MLPLTARATATIIATAKWRSPRRCCRSSSVAKRSSSTTANFLRNFRRNMRRDLRKYVLELLSRGRALAIRLRLQWRPCRLEPEMARSAAGGTGLAARQRCAADRKGRAGIFTDVWQARDAYIEVVLARGDVSTGNPRHGAIATVPGRSLRRVPRPVEKEHALKLMELQRHALLMYTSCGWFFDDISGIETVQIIAYAGRVVQLAGELFGTTRRGSKTILSSGCGRQRATTPGKRRRRDLSPPGQEPATWSGRSRRSLCDKLGVHHLSGRDAALRLLGPAHRRRMLATGRSQLVIGRALVSSLLTGD